MFDDTDIPRVDMSRASAGGERGAHGRESQSWAGTRASDTADEHPTVLIPDNPWAESASFPYEVEQRHSMRSAVLLILACVMGAAVFYALRQFHRLPFEVPVVASSSGEMTSAPISPTASPAARPVLPHPRSAELEIGGALPGGAQVTVNGWPLKTQRVTLDSGTYVVRVSAPGYRGSAQTLRLSAGKITVWTPQLTRLREPQPREVSQRSDAAERVSTAHVLTRRRVHDVPPAHIASSRPVRHAPVTTAAPPAPTRVAHARPVDPPSSSTATCAAAYGTHDWSTATRACEREAQAGNASAQRNLGVMYDRGLGVAQDHVEAAQWLRRAAGAGSRDAEYQLGTMYQEGRGVRRDDGEAVRWFRQAALLGDPDAQVKLGLAYEHGAGVAMNLAQAMAWFRSAAGHGDDWAQNHIGWMFANGKGVPIDYAKAVTWFRRAADRGDAQAQYNLGYMYENGFGVERSLADAAEWYRRAARQGNAEARRVLQLWRVQP